MKKIGLFAAGFSVMILDVTLGYILMESEDDK